MPDISDEELRILQGSRQLMDKLLKNPKTQLAQQKLIKEAMPDADIVTVEDTPLYQQLQDTQKQLRELTATLANDKVDRLLDADFSTLRTHGYQDEGIAEIKKIMVDRKIPNAIDAAAVWEKRNPPKQPEPMSGYSPTSWNFGAPAGKDDELKLLYQDEDAWADQEARKVFQEAAQAAQQGNQIRI